MAGGSKTKGNSERLIHTPGYHIHPQYDLKHTRQALAEKRAKKSSFALSLAPMVDMFSILVIYLIMNFSDSGEIFFVSKDIEIPKISKGTPLQSFPLVSIVKDQVVFDAPANGEMGNVYVSEANNEEVPQFRAMLKQVKRIEEAIGGAEGFKGQINLQADVRTPVEDVKKVMRVLIDEGWTGINFIVEAQGKNLKK